MSKGTARRAVRVEDELWEGAKEKAAESGDNLSDIMREALKQYINKGDQVSKKTIMKDKIRNHQPSGGGYGIALSCSCGADFSAAHQIEMVLTAWEAEGETHRGGY